MTEQNNKLKSPVVSIKESISFGSYIATTGTSQTTGNNNGTISGNANTTGSTNNTGTTDQTTTNISDDK